MNSLEIPLCNSEFSTEILLISPEEVDTFQTMGDYIYNLPTEPVLYRKIKAVIDTGSTHTIIPEKVALDLRLEETGKKQSTKLAGGVTNESTDYLCMICFPSKTIVMMTVSALKGKDENEVLIGMDFLQYYNFTYHTNFSKKSIVSPYGGKLEIKFD